MTELKPCPFCGGEPTIDRHYIGQRKADYRIICKHCGARFFWFDRLFKAIEAWNRRAEMSEEEILKEMEREKNGSKI